MSDNDYWEKEALGDLSEEPTEHAHLSDIFLERNLPSDFYHWRSLYFAALDKLVEQGRVIKEGDQYRLAPPPAPTDESED